MATGQAADAATPLEKRATRLHKAGHDDQAIPLAERVLAIREKALGPEHAGVATALEGLALLYTSNGDYARAEPLLVRATSIREKLPGDHLDLAESLDVLASVCYHRGDYARAEPLFERALAIRETVLGTEHADVATSLNNLAILYMDRSDFGRAEPLFLRALAIKEKALGAEHGEVAISLNNLANLYAHMGDYARAEPLARRALAIKEKVFGGESPAVATSLTNLANVLAGKGDYAGAEPVFLRALTINERRLGPLHPTLTDALNGLANLYIERSDYRRAEPLLVRAVAIRERVLGANHPDLATSLNDLANLYASEADYPQAERLYARALHIKENSLGVDHPDVARCLTNLAGLLKDEGDYARAEPLYLRALSIWERVAGATHPDVATLLDALSSLYTATDDLPHAVAFRIRASDLREQNARRELTTGSEQQKLAYMMTVASVENATVSLHLRSAPMDAGAARLAFLTVLRRKGRVLDAMTDVTGSLRGRLGPDARLLDQLRDTRRQLAALELEVPDTRTVDGAALEQRTAKRRALEEEEQRVESELSARSAAFRSVAAPVTIEAVARAIPPHAMLVELVRYRPRDPRASPEKRLGPPRYAAYALAPTGQIQWTDLGDAAALEQEAEKLRRALKDDRRADFKEVARGADVLLGAPIRALVGDATSVLLAPDAALNLVPFGALVDEQGRYMLERYAVSYLTTGRDLLRMEAANPARSAPLVVANPAYDGALEPPGTQSALATRAASSLQGDVLPRHFGALDGTAREASAITTLFSAALVRTGDKATKGVLLGAHGPEFLHLATHGFFRPDPSPDEALGPEAALLRAGLAFAGANRPGHREDGILTALEASGLDLAGTKLVVLSACETGLGEAQPGESVYGLRRALVLAGAESQVVSLWPVDDDATRALMTDYYRRLSHGASRTDALRDAELGLLADPETRAPYYWAAFVAIGDWRALDGREARPSPPAGGLAKVTPSPRGCACTAVGRANGDVERESDGITALLAAVILAGVAGVRSRRRRLVDDRESG